MWGPAHSGARGQPPHVPATSGQPRGEAIPPAPGRSRCALAWAVWRGAGGVHDLGKHSVHGHVVQASTPFGVPYRVALQPLHTFIFQDALRRSIGKSRASLLVPYGYSARAACRSMRSIAWHGTIHEFLRCAGRPSLRNTQAPAHAHTHTHAQPQAPEEPAKPHEHTHPLPSAHNCNRTPPARMNMASRRRSREPRQKPPPRRQSGKSSGSSHATGLHRDVTSGPA